MKNSLQKSFVVVFTLFSVLVITGLALANSRQASAPPPTLPTSDGVISLAPDQFTLTGDVTTFENAQGHCTEPWFTDTPPGTIILGANPANCEPESWSGGTATTDIFLPNPNPKTVYVLKLAWPDHDGKGLHSPNENQTAVITLNGKPLWSKRTTEVSTYGDYYGAQHEAIQTTLVVTQSLTHTLSIHVPAHTAWDLSFITLTPYPLPATVRGIGYSPYRDCQAPGGDIEPTIENVQEDLVRLFHTSNFIRTYAATGIHHEIPALANAQGLPIFAGAWLDDDGSDPAPDDEEIQALIDIANTNDLEGAIVGNEYILRHNAPAFMDYLLQRIHQVRSGLDDPTLPLMTAEIDGIMFTWDSQDPTVITGIVPAYRPILDEVDYVLVHIYPFWMYRPVDGAAAFTVARYKAIQALLAQEYPGQNKRVIIGETGWPSAGPSLGAAVPSLANQARYLKEFIALAEQEQVDYLYFDAMDELWKTEGGVGSHWGYSYVDRSAKHAFYGVLIPGNALFPFLSYLPFVAQGSSNSFGTFSLNGLLNLPPVTPSMTSFPVYLDWPGAPDGFVPAYVGDDDNISTYACDRTDPAEGETAIRATFTPTGTLGWGGESWLYPASNHADLEAGKDFSWANKIVFQAKGAVGGEKIEFFAGGAGTVNDPYPESLRPVVSTGHITLGTDWQTYTIDLRGENLTHIITGFGWATTQCANPTGATFYLDNIRWEYDPDMPPVPPLTSFPVYTDAAAQANHYVPSNWMGDATIDGHVSLSECWPDNPHSGATSVRSAYTQSASYGWAGVYWAFPAENWGDRPGGYDLTGAKRLTFWARSETGNPQVTFLIGGVGYYNNTCTPLPGFPFPDSVCPTLRQTETLSPTWTQYTIDLLQNPRLLDSVVGGFGWVSENPVIFYLDDILYEFE